MATLERKYDKATGELLSCRITVAGGLDSTGKQIRYRKNWKPAKTGMTPRQIEKALTRAAADFEREIEHGYQLDYKQTFSEYARYVIDLKERSGIRPRTIDQYKALLVRIDQAIGHMKIADIRPQHLNSFYKNLGEAGVREDGERATARIDLAAWLKKHKLSREKLGRRAGISPNTVSTAVQGGAIRKAKAEKIAAAMGVKLTDAFKIQKDTTPLAEKTILEYHRLISSVLSQAEKEMLILYNPASKATPPKVSRKTPDYYQPDQLDQILDALEDAPLKWKAMTYLLIDTGCRRGEAAGLKWDRVDLDSGIITIDRALLYSQGRGVYEGPPKNGKSRTVKLAPETLALLEQHRLEQIEMRLKNGDRWVDSGFVFTQENGDRINPDSISGWLGKFAEQHGLPHLHPHAFRHTAASTMIASGIDLVTTASELGHSNATTTATIYAHQIAEAKAKASEARSSVFTHRKRANKKEA